MLQLWSEYQAAEDRIKVYENSEAKHQEYVHQIQRRAQEGFSAPSDVQLSMSRLSSVQADIRQVRSIKVNAAIKIEQMLQKPLVSKLEKLKDSGWPQSIEDISSWSHSVKGEQLDDIVKSYPAVQKANLLIEVAKAEESLIESRNYPEVYLRAESRRGDVTKTNQSVYLGFSSSFGAGLSNLAASAAAQARVEAQRNEVAAREMEVREIIQADIQSFQTQFDRLGQLEHTYTANHRYLESSERQYLAGRRSWQEIMNIAREESQILSQIVDAKAQIWLAHQRLQIYTNSLDGYLSSGTSVNTTLKN